MLKLHPAGSLYYNDGMLGGRGLGGYYWSSSLYDSGYGHYLDF